jgi:hypothetical protein
MYHRNRIREASSLQFFSSLRSFLKSYLDETRDTIPNEFFIFKRFCWEEIGLFVFEFSECKRKKMLEIAKMSLYYISDLKRWKICSF